MVSDLWCDTTKVAELAEVASRYSGFPVTSLQVRELVADVLGDAFTEDLACTSEDSESLRLELVAEVTARARRARRGGRHAALPLEVAPPSALIASSATDERAEAMEGVLQAVGERARDDLLVWKLLDVYEDAIALGVDPSRREALRRGMSDWGYRCARERLAEYAQAVHADRRPDHSHADVAVADTD